MTIFWYGNDYTEHKKNCNDIDIVLDTENNQILLWDYKEETALATIKECRYMGFDVEIASQDLPTGCWGQKLFKT